MVKLNYGRTIPQLGLGTWLSNPGEVGAAISDAIEVGYRHFDCAQVYGNQEEIGISLREALLGGKIMREEMFVTSKIWNTFHSRELAKKAVNMILDQLKLDYLDLCLIHWPQGFQEGGEFIPKNDTGGVLYSDVDYIQTWQAMEKAVKQGKIRSIGLSNFNSQQIQRIWDHAIVKPSVVQVECHPYFPQRKLESFCLEKNIVLTAYSPFTNPGSIFRKEGDGAPCVLYDPVIDSIADSLKKIEARSHCGTTKRGSPAAGSHYAKKRQKPSTYC